MRARLKEVEDEIDALPLKKRSRVQPRPDELGDLAGDVGDPEPMAETVEPSGPGGAEPDADCSSSDAASSSSTNSSSLAGDTIHQGYSIPTSIEGMKVTIEEHSGDKRSFGIRVRCPHHEDCRRCVSLVRYPLGFGPQGAQLLLGAWLRLAAPDNKSHKAKRLTKTQMQSHAATLP